MKKYIFVDSGNKISHMMFQDIESQSDMTLLKEPYHIKGKFKRLLNKISNVYRINSRITVPFRNYWNRYSSIESCIKNDNDEYIIGFTNISVVRYTIKYLNELAKKKNIKLILLCLDPFFDQIRAPLEYIKKVNFYKVFTFDKTDAQNYNLNWTYSYYSMTHDLIKNNINSDVFFVGFVKDRKQIIEEWYNCFISNGVQSNFIVIDKHLKKDSGIYKKHKVSYQEVLENIISTNCILEINQFGQTGQTLRFFEAVCYNKKLITNNRYIKYLPYYNENYMKIVNSVEDIDINWLLSKEKVEYNYKGEFSPVHLLRNV